MSNYISESDRKDFALYLRKCTDAQVQGVYDKEQMAGRTGYADMAVTEAQNRNIELNR